MKKRVLTLICAALLVLLPAVHAGAELDLVRSGDKAEDIVIFYVPATADETIMRTARYVVQSIHEANSGREINLYRTDSNPKDEFNPQKSISKGAVKGDDEFKVIKGKNIDRFEKKAHEYWVLIPYEASDAFYTAKVTERFRSLLSKEGAVMHIVLIGDKTKEPSEESALSKLSAECEVDWIRIRSDFQTETVDEKEYSSGGTMHTGDYLLALLRGRQCPLDLTVDRDGDNWKFKPVEKTTVLLLIRWEGEPKTVTVTDPEGNLSTEKKEITISQEGSAGYSVISIDKLGNEKEYTVDAPGADSVKAYYFLDLNTIVPELKLPDQAMIGENTLQLNMGNLLGAHKLDVIFDIYKNEEKNATGETAEFDSDNNVWTKTINLDKSYKFFKVVPRVYLFMEDGNRVKYWDDVEPDQRMLEVGGVTTLENADKNITLYYDSHDPELTVRKSYEWKEFFSFNPGDFDNLGKEVEVAEELTNAGLTVIKTKDSKIEIILKKSEAKSKDSSEETLSETIKETETEGDITTEKTDKPDVVKFKLNEHPYELRISLKDVNELREGIRLAIQEETIHVGGKQIITATIDADAIAAWGEASDQIAEFPALDQIQLFFADDDGDGAPMLQQEDGSWQAQKSLSIGVAEAPGSRNIKVQIKMGKNNREESLSFDVINTPPYLKEEAPEAVQKIEMSGWPWNYTPNENLLKVLTGVDNPIDLFSDDETEDYTLSVKVILDNDNGLILPEDAEKQQENDWIIELSNKEDSAPITATEPGEHKLTIIASDGVNSSEPLEISFKVYSVVLRYVSYAALGLAAFLLILVMILIIHHARKPSFDRISIRCFAGADEDVELAKEVLNKSNPVSMMNFGKKPVTLTTALILTRQPPMDQEISKVTDDIILLPTKHDELSIRFGKKALEKMGRHEKKELLSRGNTNRMRIGNTYIQIENVQR